MRLLTYTVAPEQEGWPLRRLLPPLRACTLKRELVVCIFIMIVGFFAVGISSQFFPPV